MDIRESGENYLETILMLYQKAGYVRSIDVANHMNFSKASVSRAMGKLKEGGFITIDSDNHIHLTKQGKEVAEEIYERHRLFTDFLIRIGVNPDVAKEDACRIEHVLSKESFAKIKEHVQDEMKTDE